MQKFIFVLTKVGSAWYNIRRKFKNAGVAELADVQDLGSCVYDVQVQPLSPAPYRNSRVWLFRFLFAQNERYTFTD